MVVPPVFGIWMKACVLSTRKACKCCSLVLAAGARALTITPRLRARRQMTGQPGAARDRPNGRPFG
eukprot:31864-Prymnesium_polylepis.1